VEIRETKFHLTAGKTLITDEIMKNPIGNLNKVFDSRIRMGVMSILLMNEEISFNDLKQLLELTDGNLASHMINLEENGFIKVHKGFIGRKTNTTYSITKAGEKAFKEHLEALESMIRGVHKGG
jgi:DNA-binding MarR family transcriptional regulator